MKEIQYIPLSNIRGPFLYFSTNVFSSSSNPFNSYERRNSYVFVRTYMFYIHSKEEFHEAIPIPRNFILIYFIPYHSNLSLALLLSWMLLGAHRERASERPYFFLAIVSAISYHVTSLHCIPRPSFLLYQQI